MFGRNSKSEGLSINCFKQFNQHKNSRPHQNFKSSEQRLDSTYSFNTNTSFNDNSSFHDHKINNISNNLLMDDSTESSIQGDFANLPGHIEAYYVFKDGRSDLKNTLEDIKGLQRRKMRDAFGFNRGLESRLKKLWNKANSLSKGNHLLIFHFVYNLGFNR